MGVRFMPRQRHPKYLSRYTTIVSHDDANSFPVIARWPRRGQGALPAESSPSSGGCVTALVRERRQGCPDVVWLEHARVPGLRLCRQLCDLTKGVQAAATATKVPLGCPGTWPSDRPGRTDRRALSPVALLFTGCGCTSVGALGMEPRHWGCVDRGRP